MLTFNLMILLNKNISNKSTKLGVENKARGEVFFHFKCARNESRDINRTGSVNDLVVQSSALRAHAPRETFKIGEKKTPSETAETHYCVSFRTARNLLFTLKTQ